MSRQEVMVAWPEMVSLSLERSWIYLTNKKHGKKKKRKETWIFRAGNHLKKIKNSPLIKGRKIE